MTTITNPVELPVRFSMRPDEWTETYLVTLARAQGLRRPKACDVERLRTVLLRKQSMAVAHAPLSPASSQNTPGEAQHGEESLPSWAVIARSAPLRYCPFCLNESRYFRSRWRLAGLHVCTVHGCRLKSDLFEEAITTYLARRKRTSAADADAAKLLDGAVCCSANELRATKMVWGQLEMLAQTASTPEDHRSLAPLACWSAVLWEVIDTVSFAHHQQVIHQATNGPLARVARFVRDFDVATEPSLEGMLALFSRFSENAHFRAAKRRLDGLEAQGIKDRTTLSRLPLRYLCERLTALEPKALVPRPVGGTALRGVSEHSIFKAALVAQLAPLGPGSGAVDRLLRSGQIPTTKVLRGGAEFTVIERAHARQARRAMLSLINADEFMAQHELDTSVYSVIRETPLLKTGPLRGYLYRQEIAALVTRLELMSGPGADERGPRWRVFSATTVSAVGGRSMFFDFVQAAIQGQFKVFRDLSKQGLSAFSIGTDAIRWATSRRQAIQYARAPRPTVAQIGLFDAQESEVMA